ncbi:hypothetical protein ACLOJK_031092 [Asimina triloba]
MQGCIWWDGRIDSVHPAECILPDVDLGPYSLYVYTNTSGCVTSSEKPEIADRKRKRISKQLRLQKSQCRNPAASSSPAKPFLPSSLAQSGTFPSMHRSLSRDRLPWIVNSLRSCGWREARSHATGGMEVSQSFVEGFDRLKSWEPSALRLMQVQIVKALRSGERGQASELLLNLTKRKEPLRRDDFLYILEYCSTSPDPLFALETWRLMQQKEIPVNRRCCMFIIRSLSKGGYLKEAYDWLTFLGGHHETNPSLPMYNILLNGCAEMQSSDHADYCLGLMDDRQIGKSEITYWELLKLAVSKQNLSVVHEIWKECTNYYNPSIVSLRKFVWSFARLQDLESAHSILQHMVGLVLQGGTSIRTSADGRFISSRVDIPIPSKKTSGMTESRCSELSFHADSLVKIGDWNSCRTNPRVDLCPTAYPTMVGMEQKSGGFGMLKDITSIPVMKVLRWSFSDVIHACVQSKDSELAEQLFLQMHKIGLEPSPYTYDGLLKAVISGRGVVYGMKVFKEMEKRNLKPYNSTLGALSVGYSKILELDLAELLLDQIGYSLSLDIHPFNALLAACDVMDQHERAVRVLAKMRHLKLKFDIRTYERLFSLFGNVNAPYKKGNTVSKVDVSKRIRAIEMDMRNNQLYYISSSVSSSVQAEGELKALGAEGMTGSMIQYLCVADRLFCHTDTHPGTILYNIVLRALVEAKQCHTAIKLFLNMKSCDIRSITWLNRKAFHSRLWWLQLRSQKQYLRSREQYLRRRKLWRHTSRRPMTLHWLKPRAGGTPFMKLRDIPPDTETYNVMINCCNVIRRFKFASKFASALVSMMIRDGFSPDIFTYTALIKTLLRNGDFDGSLNLVEQARNDGIQLDVVLFNTILRQAYRKGRIDIIEHVLERMHQEKIQPDPTTCTYVFSAYVNRGFLTTAIESLQILSMRIISEKETVLQDKRMDYEELILDEDPEAESRIIKIFMDLDEHLAVALLNLRWMELALVRILDITVEPKPGTKPIQLGQPTIFLYKFYGERNALLCTVAQESKLRSLVESRRIHLTLHASVGISALKSLVSSDSSKNILNQRLSTKDSSNGSRPRIEPGEASDSSGFG